MSSKRSDGEGRGGFFGRHAAEGASFAVLALVLFFLLKPGEGPAMSAVLGAALLVPLFLLLRGPLLNRLAALLAAAAYVVLLFVERPGDLAAAGASVCFLFFLRLLYDGAGGKPLRLLMPAVCLLPAVRIPGLAPLLLVLPVVFFMLDKPRQSLPALPLRQWPAVILSFAGVYALAAVSFPWAEMKAALAQAGFNEVLFRQWVIAPLKPPSLRMAEAFLPVLGLVAGAGGLAVESIRNMLDKNEETPAAPDEIVFYVALWFAVFTLAFQLFLPASPLYKGSVLWPAFIFLPFVVQRLPKPYPYVTAGLAVVFGVLFVLQPRKDYSALAARLEPLAAYLKTQPESEGVRAPPRLVPVLRKLTGRPVLSPADSLPAAGSFLLVLSPAPPKAVESGCYRIPRIAGGPALAPWLCEEPVFRHADKNGDEVLVFRVKVE